MTAPAGRAPASEEVQMDRETAEAIVADYLGIPADLILPTDLDDLDAAPGCPGGGALIRAVVEEVPLTPAVKGENFFNPKRSRSGGYSRDQPERALPRCASP